MHVAEIGDDPVVGDVDWNVSVLGVQVADICDDPALGDVDSELRLLLVPVPEVGDDPARLRCCPVRVRRAHDYADHEILSGRLAILNFCHWYFHSEG